MGTLTADETRLLEILKEEGVEVSRWEVYDDNRGVSVFWRYHGQAHSSGGDDLVDALNWIIYHIDQGRE